MSNLYNYTLVHSFDEYVVPVIVQFCIYSRRPLVPTINKVILKFAAKHDSRLHQHPNPLVIVLNFVSDTHFLCHLHPEDLVC